jgi:hypothetical protein
MTDGPDYGVGVLIAAGRKLFGSIRGSTWHEDWPAQLELTGGFEPTIHPGQRWSACPVLTVAGSSTSGYTLGPIQTISVEPGLDFGFELQPDAPSAWGTLGFRLAHAAARATWGYYTPDCPFIGGVVCTEPPVLVIEKESMNYGVLTAGFAVVGRPLSGRMGVSLPTYIFNVHHRYDLFGEAHMNSVVVSLDLAVNVPL